MSMVHVSKMSKACSSPFPYLLLLVDWGDGRRGAKLLLQATKERDILPDVFDIAKQVFGVHRLVQLRWWVL